MDAKAPLNYSTRRSFSRRAGGKNVDERVTLKSLSKKSIKRRKTLLHGFHFHYETHNRRNLTGKKIKKQGVCGVVVRVKRRRGGAGGR